MQMMKFLGENGISHLFNYSVSTGIDSARSRHATEFLASNCTHLLFLDDDMAFPADIALRLALEDLDIVGVPYRRKDIKPRFTCRHGADLERFTSRPYLIKVTGLGCGCILIRRNVLETLAPTLPKIQFDKDEKPITMFFRHELVDDEMIGGLSYVSEDYNFCRVAKHAGFDTWAYVDEDLAHMGNVAFRGNYADILEKDSNAGEPLRDKNFKMQLRMMGEV